MTPGLGSLGAGVAVANLGAVARSRPKVVLTWFGIRGFSVPPWPAGSAISGGGRGEASAVMCAWRLWKAGLFPARRRGS